MTTLNTHGAGDKHQWEQADKIRASFSKDLIVCKRCGIVRRRDGKNNPCKGWAKLRPMERL